MTNAATSWYRALGLLGLLVIYTPVLAQDQPLTDKDRGNIKYNATKKLNDLNDLLNTLAVIDLERADADSLIRSSYLKNSNQLFLNAQVPIEDDIDPTHTSADSTADASIDKYMHDLYLFYLKTTLDKPIVFSDIQFFPIQQSDNSYYIKGIFTSLFKNRHKYINVPYKPTHRVIEMRVEKVANKWTLYITRLGFLQPGEGIAPVIKHKAAVAAAFVKPVIPTNLKIGGPEIMYRQPGEDYTATLKFDRNWLQVLQTGSAEIPVGFYQRRGKEEIYVYDSLISITLEKNSDQFTFRQGVNYNKFIRVNPTKTTTTVAPPVTPVTVQSSKADSLRTAQLLSQRPPKTGKPTVDSAARVVVAPKPKIDTKPILAKPGLPPVNLPARADTAKVIAFQTPILKTPDKTDGKLSEKEKEKPIMTAPVSKTLAPALANALSADARQEKARYRTLGWLQVVAGVAGLAGSYAGYSTIKKDYDAYSAKLTKLNADYTIWQGLTRQPASNPAATVSLSSYGSPGIYGVYGGSAISLGLIVNGIRSLGKVKDRK